MVSLYRFYSNSTFFLAGKREFEAGIEKYKEIESILVSGQNSEDKIIEIEQLFKKKSNDENTTRKDTVEIERLLSIIFSFS